MSIMVKPCPEPIGEFHVEYMGWAGGTSQIISTWNTENQK